jgi:hypothetical protein
MGSSYPRAPNPQRVAIRVPRGTQTSAVPPLESCTESGSLSAPASATRVRERAVLSVSISPAAAIPVDLKLSWLWITNIPTHRHPVASYRSDVPVA